MPYRVSLNQGGVTGRSKKREEGSGGPCWCYRAGLSVIRILALHVGREDEMLRHPDGFEAQLLGSAGHRNEKLGSCWKESESYFHGEAPVSDMQCAER